MACSKRHCGYVFLGIGLLFIFIGVICGILLPKVITKIIAEKTCVDSKNDPEYNDWAKPQDRRITKLYYWVIKNKDKFLYHGELPELEERGPYTYRLKSSKINVSFENNRRIFKDWTMEGVFLKDMSCSDCSEHDNITILNPGYLGTMAKYNGDLSFAFLNLPYILSVLLKDLNYSYTQLGNITGTTWVDRDGSGWGMPEFGAWLKHSVGVNITKSFTEVEMKGLYNALTSLPTLFGATLTDDTIKEACSKNAAGQFCGLLQHLTLMLTKPNNTHLVYIYIASALCTNTTVNCFNNTQLMPYILPYIMHVNKYTMWYLLHEQDDLVITTSQRNLALGYTLKKIYNPQTNAPIRIPGFLQVIEKEEDAKKLALSKSLYTCGAEKEKRHQWVAYNGKQDIPSDLFNISAHDRVIQGYSMLVPHSNDTDKACVFSRSLPMNTFEVFVPEVYIKLKLTYKEDALMYGLNVKRYVVLKEDFLRHSGVKQGMMDQSQFRNMPFVFSLPHYLYAYNTTIPKSFNQKPVENDHKSIFDIDPVTGGVVRAYLKAQINNPIPDNFISVQRIKPFNISYVYKKDEDNLLNYGIPVFWSDNGGEAKKEDIEVIKTKIVGLLGLSCGLLIAFPVIGGVFVIVFVALFAVSIKANQIRQIHK